MAAYTMSLTGRALASHLHHIHALPVFPQRGESLGPGQQR